MRIYITYCSAQKNDSLKGTDIEVAPDVLYTSKHRIQPFMETCKRQGVSWAIFSDHYGVWFPKEKRSWYDKPPSAVTKEEFQKLLENFDRQLAAYEDIFFYRPSPVYFHSLYQRLLKESKLSKRIRIISSITEIVR